jgi:hypothetical protein
MEALFFETGTEFLNIMEMKLMLQKVTNVSQTGKS